MSNDTLARLAQGAASDAAAVRALIAEKPQRALTLAHKHLSAAAEMLRVAERLSRLSRPADRPCSRCGGAMAPMGGCTQCGCLDSTRDVEGEGDWGI